MTKWTLTIGVAALALAPGGCSKGGDHGGATAAIVGSDDKRSNGVIDHIDTVLVPK